MRKLLVLVMIVVISVNDAYAGGIVTNTNQSASFIRMPARDASLSIDAAFYNPAGLTRLADGLHISVNSQYISQNRTIKSTLPSLNNDEFLGTLTIPVFPSVYSAYKTGNFAFSLGLNVIGGGGGAEYETGIPSAEAGVSQLVPALGRYGVTGYRNDTYFEGSSAYYSGQLGISFEMFGMVSVYGGARIVMARNVYEGYIRNIEVNTPEGWMKPGTYLRNYIAPTLSGLQRNIVLNTANAVSAATVDASVDVTQKGLGYTPVAGINIKPNDRLNIGIKYEFITEIELENETFADGTGMFPDNATFRNDLPAMLSIGGSYQATPKMNVAAGVHYYFDKQADYSRTINGVRVNNDMVIDYDFFEAAVGVEYNLTEDLIISGGYLRTQTGVNENYQTDISHSLSTNTFGFGGRYAINEMIALNLGVMKSLYVEGSRRYSYENVSVKETYNRDNMVFAIGLDLKF